MNEWLQSRKLDYVVLFVLFFCLLAFIQLVPALGDPDGFYHAKMALFLSQGIVLRSLPWMQFSTLRDAFTDHHLLYHIALIPFVAFGKPLLGVKLATVFFSSAFFVTFYWSLKRLRCTAPVLYTLILFSCSAFVFRLSLVKANSLSLIMALLISIAVVEKRTWLVLILSAIYVWLYGGWFLAWAIVAVYCLVEAVAYFFPGARHRFTFWVKHKPAQQLKPLGGLIAATVAGSFVGLILNPYWPRNIMFYVQQLWQIAILNQSASINVGGEWSSLSSSEFISFFSFLLIFFGITLFLVITQASRLKTRSWFAFILACLFIVFTVKSRRYIELSAPFTVLASALVWTDVFPDNTLKKIWHAWRVPAQWLKKLFATSVGIGSALFILLYLTGPWSELTVVRGELGRGIPLHRYEKVSQWLSQSTVRWSSVVHSDWDDWPMLFYYDTRNRYIIGLDPRFMYDYDPLLFQQWSRLTSSGIADNVVELVTHKLQSQYVMIDKDHTAMQKLFADNIYFRLAYEDEEVWVYSVINGA